MLLGLFELKRLKRLSKYLLQGFGFRVQGFSAKGFLGVGVEC